MPSVNNSVRTTSHCVQLRIQSRLAAVPLLASMVGCVCESAGLSSTDRQLVGLCLVEAANNAILHAYSEDPSNTVIVDVMLSSQQLVFDVIDSGKSGDPAVMNADHRAALGGEQSSNILAESGRGLAIMQEVMDSVEYTVQPGNNRLRLVKYLDTAQNIKEVTKARIASGDSV